MRSAGGMAAVVGVRHRGGGQDGGQDGGGPEHDRGCNAGGVTLEATVHTITNCDHPERTLQLAAV